MRIRISATASKLIAVCAALAVAALGVCVSPALAGVANAGLPGASPSNPLAGMTWGIYRGPLDELYPRYASSQGTDRQLLAKEALAPSVHWLGSWDADPVAGDAASQIIRYSGGPNVLSEIAVFRLTPWEGKACTTLPTADQQQSYKTWINNFASAVGSARLLVILQPDLPFALCQPGHSQVSLNLVAYASQVLSALPHTSVYIDAGAADYTSVSDSAWLLEHAGIRSAQGFALNDTHSDDTGKEIRFGQKLSQALGRAHISGMHFVVNTAQNGAPFTAYSYNHIHQSPPVCTSRSQHRCLTLGIPPTTDVANARWHLSAQVRAIARKYVDGYVWVSRPWLLNGAGAFDLQRALDMARTSPF